MSDFFLFPIVFFVGIATGFFDSTAGAGGLISVPSLIFLGLPPHIAIATDRLGTLGQTIAAFFKFNKAKKIVWKYVPFFAVISIVGSLVGANMLLNINPDILQKIVGFVVLTLLFFIFIKRTVGVERIQTNKLKKGIGLVGKFFVSIFGGFIGQGTGPFNYYILTFFMGFTAIEVLATGVVTWFVSSVATLILFALKGVVNYQYGFVLLVGMAIGGHIGAHMALKKGNVWLRRLFIAFVIISAIKLLIN